MPETPGVVKGVEGEATWADVRRGFGLRLNWHMLRMMVLDRLGAKRGALRAVEAALQLDPGIAEAHFVRGVLLSELDRLPEAVEAYREGLRLEPADAVAQLGLGVSLFRLEKAEPALRALREAVRLDTESADAQIALGHCLSMLGREKDDAAMLPEGGQAGTSAQPCAVVIALGLSWGNGKARHLSGSERVAGDGRSEA